MTQEIIGTMPVSYRDRQGQQQTGELNVYSSLDKEQEMSAHTHDYMLGYAAGYAASGKVCWQSRQDVQETLDAGTHKMADDYRNGFCDGLLYPFTSLADAFRKQPGIPEGTSPNIPRHVRAAIRAEVGLRNGED